MSGGPAFKAGSFSFSFAFSGLCSSLGETLSVAGSSFVLLVDSRGGSLLPFGVAASAVAFTVVVVASTGNDRLDVVFPNAMAKDGDLCVLTLSFVTEATS